jgi:glycosyltransferase involved in cell wall biosynthesis
VHIRLLRSLTNLPGHDVRVVDTAWLLAGGMHHLDVVVIQRDAVPAALVEPLIAQLRAQGVPFVYEIDDLLWQLPEEHTDHSIDAAQQEAIQVLMRAATVVTTSTPNLAKVIGAYNDQVVVIPNALDTALWLQPLDSTRLDALRKQHRLSPERQRILYMGTRSHATDLVLIAEAVEEVVRTQPDIDIIQIGGGTPLPHARMLTPPKECSSYPEFVAWFRHIAATATIALAPLEDTAFNDAKSDIKTLDYGLARVPAVFSCVGPYRAAVEHRKTGLLCRNETGEWIKAMRQLLEDASLREVIEAAAFERACDRSCNAYTEPVWTRLFHQILTTSLSQDATGTRRSLEMASSVIVESETV